jgi:L-ascorbate metabolism protein UlaG (beta-lactamase superfamily)
MIRFGSAALLAALVLTSLAAQEPKDKAVKVRWFGQSFFQIETPEGRLIAVDPHAIPVFGRQPVTAEFVLLSHSHADHSLIEAVGAPGKGGRVKEGDVYRGVTGLKDGKQEWKLIDEKRGGIRVRTVPTYHDATNGMQRGKNSAWVIETNGLTLCHLGDLGHELSAAQIKAIGKVDVLMVPVGGIYTINGEQAQKVVEQLKPRLYVLPMHYGVPGYDDLAGPDEFLDGFKKDRLVKSPDTNELVIPTDLTADAPKVVLMGWRKGEPKK